MTEVEWSEESESAPKKKGGIPKWVWIGCGGGCLLLILGTIAVTIAGAIWVKDAADPEKQWPKLQQVLPFEERPATLDLGMGMGIPFVMDQYVLSNHAEKYTATIMNFKAAASGDFDQMFRADPDNAPFGLGAPVEPEVGELGIQGESVRTLRFKTLGGQGMVDQLGPGIRVDLSRPGRTLMVELRRMGNQDPLTDESIIAFFDNFDVWADD